MKLSPKAREQNSLFLSSKFSADGFLGSDTRPIDDIIAADTATVVQCGTTCKKIAGILTKLFTTAEAALGTTVSVKNGITITHAESRGKVPSPFRGEGVFAKGEVALTIPATGHTLFITRLGIHLIEKHCFFQGHGSRYRIEPKIAATLL